MPLALPGDSNPRAHFLTLSTPAYSYMRRRTNQGRFNALSRNPDPRPVARSHHASRSRRDSWPEPPFRLRAFRKSANWMTASGEASAGRACPADAARASLRPGIERWKSASKRPGLQFISILPFRNARRPAPGAREFRPDNNRHVCFACQPLGHRDSMLFRSPRPPCGQGLPLLFQCAGNADQDLATGQALSERSLSLLRSRLRNDRRQTALSTAAATGCHSRRRLHEASSSGLRLFRAVAAVWHILPPADLPRVEIFYGVNARIWAIPVSSSHITVVWGALSTLPTRNRPESAQFDHLRRW